MSRFVYQGRHGQKPDPARCCMSVNRRGIGFFSFQCSNKVAVRREYEGALRGFCKVHDPVAVKAKDEAKRVVRDEQWSRKQASWAEEDRRRKAYEAYRDALRAIADGDNDARTTATVALKLNGDWT